MCGIAGLIHRGKKSDVGAEMTSMLQALKHRGPDSTGYAVYGAASEGDYIMRFILAEQDAMRKSFDMKDKVAARLEAVEKRLGDIESQMAQGDVFLWMNAKLRDFKAKHNFKVDIPAVDRDLPCTGP